MPHPLRFDAPAFGILAVLFLVVGCASGESITDPDWRDALDEEPMPAPLEGLPLLPTGRHWASTLFGGGGPPDEGLLPRLNEATAAGMTGFYFMADWPALEPSPGLLALEEFNATLAWHSALGLRPLVNLSLIDIASLNLPDDLRSGDGNRLRRGLSFDSGEVRVRLFAVLDEIVPRLLDHGGFALLLGNEIDEYFREHPSADLGAYARLLNAARVHVRTLAPELAVGVTLTSQGLRSESVAEILRLATDVVAFNYYPLVTEWGDDWFSVGPLEEVPAELDDLLERYEGAPVIIQELGCPSGSGSESSPEMQAQCFRTMFETLNDAENVRFVSLFTLFDFDPPTCDLIVDIFGISESDLPGNLFDRWRSYLCTLGMLTPEFEPKPAWEAFVEMLETSVHR